MLFSPATEAANGRLWVIPMGKFRNDSSTVSFNIKKSENDSKKYQDEVIDMQQKAEILKRQMTEMEQKMGAAAKDSDEYV